MARIKVTLLCPRCRMPAMSDKRRVKDGASRRMAVPSACMQVHGATPICPELVGTGALENCCGIEW